MAPQPGESFPDLDLPDLTGRERGSRATPRLGAALARRVAAAAEGRGRQPYQSDGLTCEPAEAARGDTDYTCSRDGARISFRYGTG